MDATETLRLLALPDEELINSPDFTLSKQGFDLLENRLCLRAAVLGWTGDPLKQPLASVAAELRAMLTQTDDVLAVMKDLAHSPKPHTACIGFHKPRMRALAEEVVSKWNELVPVGTLVRFYPTWGAWNAAEIDLTERQAQMNTAGEPVLWLHKRAGCVSLWHCEPLTVPSCFVPRSSAQGIAP